jgi:hypothetical protein
VALQGPLKTSDISCAETQLALSAQHVPASTTRLRQVFDHIAGFVFAVVIHNQHVNTRHDALDIGQQG